MQYLFTQTPIVWQIIFLCFAIGYLSGSVPYGLLLGKLFGVGDIRNSGSGNIGATNALRVGGKKPKRVWNKDDYLSANNGLIETPIQISVAEFSSQQTCVAAGKALAREFTTTQYYHIKPMCVEK